jgi:tetratricopeptide (TPR) repeat protein
LNYPKIRETTSRALHEYATGLANSLPDKALVLSDDPMRLHAVRTVLGSAALEKHILLDTTSLGEPAYHRFLRGRYGDRWPAVALEKNASAYTPEQMIQLFMDLRAQYELIYLHPSFGNYFEAFYLEPRQLAYALKPHPPNVPEAELPAPDAALVAEQAKLWESLLSGPLKSLRADVKNLPAERARRKGLDAAFVGECYSRALDFWGVELQRAGRFDEAVKFFEEAVALNPDNAAALINRDANIAWRTERKHIARFSKEIEDKLALYPGDFRGLLNTCGPIDEPAFAMEFVRVFVQAALYRQAAQNVHRALVYAPDDILYQSTLANLNVLSQRPDVALTQIKTIRSQPSWQSAEPTLQIEVARVEAVAHYVKDDFPAAEKILRDQIRRFPQVDAGYDALWQLHLAYHDKLRNATNNAAAGAHLTNAFQVVEEHIKVRPQNANAWFNHGNLCMFIGDWEAAIASYTKVLELQKESPAALLNRAIANLQSKKLDAAKRDYNELLKRYTTTNYKIYYGLGEIAYQEQKWEKARDYYKEYLRYAPPQLPEAKTVRERLEEVKKKA